MDSYLGILAVAIVLFSVILFISCFYISLKYFDDCKCSSKSKRLDDNGRNTDNFYSRIEEGSIIELNSHRVNLDKGDVTKTCLNYHNRTPSIIHLTAMDWVRLLTIHSVVQAHNDNNPMRTNLEDVVVAMTNDTVVTPSTGDNTMVKGFHRTHSMQHDKKGSVYNSRSSIRSYHGFGGRRSSSRRTTDKKTSYDVCSINGIV